VTETATRTEIETETVISGIFVSAATPSHNKLKRLPSVCALTPTGTDSLSLTGPNQHHDQVADRSKLGSQATLYHKLSFWAICKDAQRFVSQRELSSELSSCRLNYQLDKASMTWL